MKKTGKALSLVLSMALVVSSLTATFASAATKSETATITLNTDTIALANGTEGSLASPNLAVSDYLLGFKTAELYDHSDVSTSLGVKDVAITSGSDKIKLDKGTANSDGNYDTVTVSLKNATVSGKATLAVRYGGTVSRTSDDTTKVYGTATFTVMIYDKGQAYIAGGAAVTANGKVPAALDTMAKNDSTGVSGVVEKAQAVGTGLATAAWKVQKVYTNSAAPTATNVATEDAGATHLYQLTISGANASITAPAKDLTSDKLTTAESFTIKSDATGDKLATVGKISVYAKEFTKQSDSSYKSTDNFNVKTSVDNKYVASSTEIYISKYSNKTYIGTAEATASNKGTFATVKDITGCDVVLATSGDYVMSGGKIGDVTAPDASTATLKVEDGTVGSIATKAAVTVNGGSVGDITIADTTTGLAIAGGTVKDIDGAGKVAIKPADEDSPIKVGKISATSDLSIDSADKASVTTSDITCKANGNVVLKGDAVKVGAIDGDYRASTLTLDGFKGSIAAPSHGYTDGLNDEQHLTLNVVGDATVTGTANLYGITMGDGASLTFADKVNVGDNGASGDGVLKFAPNALYTTGDITTSIRLTKDFKVGDVAFTAATDAVDENDFSAVGFTTEKTAATTAKDAFKIKAISFASLNIQGSSKIPVGTTETYTAVTYPGGTTIPEGYTVKWSFSGNSDYLEAVVDEKDATKITVKALQEDKTFSSLNKGTLTAMVVDTDGFENYDYPEATFDVSIGAKPATFTTDSFPTSMKLGQSYQVKITGTDATKPVVAFASNFAKAVSTTTSGNDTFVKFTVMTPNAGSYGVYVSGDKKAVIAVGNACDTKTVTKTNGQNYTFKVTALSAPTFAVATVGTIKPSKVVGNDYFYTVKATANKGAHGVYINGIVAATYTFA